MENKNELLKQLGFSEQFLNALDAPDKNIIELTTTNFSMINTKTTFDSNEYILKESQDNFNPIYIIKRGR